MFPSITIGPTSFPIYGLIVAMAIFLGLLLALKRAQQYGLKKDDIYDLFLIITPLSMIFARLYHVLDKISYYQNHPYEIINLKNGGLGIFGALFGGVLAIFIYSKIKKIGLLKLTDLLIPSVVLVQVLGRWGNLVNQEAFGPPTNLPWKIFIEESHRPEVWRGSEFFHPVFLYESLPLLVLFIVLTIFSKRPLKNQGFLTAIYLMGYGTIRFFTEFFRFDTASVFGIKTAHLISVVLIFSGLVLFARHRKQIHL